MTRTNALKKIALHTMSVTFGTNIWYIMMVVL